MVCPGGINDSTADEVGIVGIGDMGSGLAKNLLLNGFDVCGFDLSSDRMKNFTAMGGRPIPALLRSQRCAGRYVRS